jgi:hypothetical protein
MIAPGGFPMARRTRFAGLALATAMIAAPAVAEAQQVRKIEVPVTSKWQHAATGLIVPRSLVGLPRTEITDSTTDESDIFLQFGDPDTTSLTIYLFRPTIADVPIWFDRVETQILGRGVYGNTAPNGDAIAFAPPRGTTAAALRRVYIPGKGPYTATGAAMLPFGDWLVAARFSSTTLDAAALDAMLVQALNGLIWPAAAEARPAPVAAPVRPCATALAFSKKAKLKKPDMTTSLLGAMLAGMARDPKLEKTPAEGPTGFCREGTPSQEAAAYRTLSGGTGYLIALGDAGRTINVNPEFSLDKGKPGYAVIFNDLSISYVFPSFDQLPAPDKVMAMVGKTRPISSSRRGSKTLNINVQQ